MARGGKGRNTAAAAGGKTAAAPTAAVGDARFQKVHNDPRFARLSKKKSKLQIDQRFAAVLKDDKFQAVQGKYDKYGRRIDKKANELKKFYRLDDEENEENDDDDDDKRATKEADSSDDDKVPRPAAAASSDASSSSDSEDAADDDDQPLTRLEYLNRMARGELASGSDTSDSSEDEDEDAEAASGDERSEAEDIPMGDETKRFAIMNCDWSRIRAVDLFALCQSFAPATGAVKDVTIYPSDFGLEKMKEEEQHGPRQLWADKGATKEEEEDTEDVTSNKVDDAKEDEEEKLEADKDDADSDDDEGEYNGDDDDAYDSDDPLGVKKSVSASETEGFDVEKLRKYELQKLKYYYAVVTCDSVKTASAIYENCDQLEYETSSNLLDLRFIPDDMDFTNPPKESCQTVPETYKPAIFATRALQQTDVKLTWEEDDDQRLELLTRQSEWKNANDDDFSAYLASENSSDDEDEDEDEDMNSEDDEDVGSAKTTTDKKKAAKLKKIKNRYRKMLLGSDGEDDGSDGAADSDDDEDADVAAKPILTSEDDDSDDDDDGGEGNMEMSFTPGAGDVLKAKRQKELEANETPFERYTREKKLEKNKKQHEKRKLQKQLAREQKDVLKKKGKAAPAELAALRAAIDDRSGGESDDDDDGDRNFDMKKIALNEKAKKLKGKRKAKEMKKLEKKAGLQEGFAFDAADPRFGALYEKGSQFQLDPTDPKFKKTEATQAIFQERRKRQSQPKSKIAATGADESKGTEKKTDKSDLTAMVENLKRKAQPPSNKKAAKPFKKPKF